MSQKKTPEEIAAQKAESQRLRKIDQVYSAIAQLLPAEGRDYFTQVHVPLDGGPAKIRVDGATPIGIAFAEHCKEHLVNKIQELGSQERADNEADMRQLAAALEAAKIKMKTGDKNGGRESRDSRGTGATSGSSPAVDSEEHVL